jgi:hypothetical protein
MSLANLSLASTFFEHIVRTNQCVKVINDIENQTHPLANIVLNAAATASNVAGLVVGSVIANNFILSAMTNGINSIITGMYDDIYADSNIARDKANISYNQSNAVYDIANSVYGDANNWISNSAFIVSNVILSNTNTYNIIINVATQHINAFINASNVAAIYGTSNGAYNAANAAFNRANLANGTANSALALATAGELTAVAAFAVANAAGASGALTAAFLKANTAHLTANTAFIATNAAFNKANSAGLATVLDVAFEQANNAFTLAGAAFIQANTAVDALPAIIAAGAASFAIANSAIINVFNETASTETFYPAMVKIASGQVQTMNVSVGKLYYKPSTGEFTSYSFNSISDEKAKEHVEKVENALELIERLNGVNFQFKDTHQKSAGVIAQNLINVVPHLVYSTEKDELLTVNYDGLSSLFIEAIKELNKEVKSIKKHLGI